jgi:hypothetical protein
MRKTPMNSEPLRREPILLQPDAVYRSLEPFRPDPVPFFFAETIWRTWSLGVLVDWQEDLRWIAVKLGPWGCGVQWLGPVSGRRG